MRWHFNVNCLNFTSTFFFLDLSDDCVVQNVNACMVDSVDSVCLKKEKFTCLFVQRLKPFVGRERGGSKLRTIFE